jgi:hypothetical protein
MCGTCSTSSGGFWDPEPVAAPDGSSSSSISSTAETDERHGLSHAIAWMAIGALLLAVARAYGVVK